MSADPASLPPDRNLALELVRVTEAAAMGASRWIGRGDKNAADKAAVDLMRLMVNTVSMRGVVVIGEGEKDEAPMLFNGEEIGDGSPPRVDIAVDPLEGTRLCAQGRPGSLAVIARVQWVCVALTAPYGIYGLLNSTFAWPSLLATAAVGILGTGVGFLMMATLTGRVGPTRSSFITYLIPVVALILGVVFRNEELATLALVGSVLVIVGAFLASRREY